jgi:serine/threonine protein kinase
MPERKRTGSRTQRRRTTRKYTRRQKQYGGDNDGYVIELDCNYIAKYVFPSKSVNWEIQTILSTIDPLRKRFVWYEKILPDGCVLPDISPPYKYKSIVYMPKVINKPQKTLTHAQKMYLRESVRILHMHGITHNDLVGNILISADDGNVRIIDWENAEFVPQPAASAAANISNIIDLTSSNNTPTIMTVFDETALKYYGC